MKPAFKTINLTKKYKEKVAVDALNLEVAEGELFALLGVNGAGKTTTIRMLTCLSMPTSGEAEIFGHPVTQEPDEVKAFGEKINAEALRDYMITVGKNTRTILEKLTLEEIRSMVPEEWVMRILEVGGVTTDFRSVWLLVFWGRLTRGGMILTPMTYHHMMHLPACIDHLSIID